MSTASQLLPSSAPNATRVLVPASPDGPAVPAILHDPDGEGAGNGWIVWAHGGSWHQGAAADWQHATGLLAALSGWKVLSLDYRLAPEHRHPAAVIDVLTAITWLSDVHPGESIVVGGDSAGATLAAVAALAARDRGVTLHAQLLAYPPLDPECRATSYHSDPQAFPPPGLLRAAWGAWRGDPATPSVAADGTPLLATPDDADTLTGVAPAVLVVGGDDPVRDDVAAYARSLSAAGVEVRHRLLPGIGHGDVLRPNSTAIRELALSIAGSHRKETQRKEQ